jgi:hypothetical protein
MEPPCNWYFDEDFETNDPGVPPDGWSVTGTVECVSHRGGVWARLGSRGSMQRATAVAPAERLRCTVEVLSLAPEGTSDRYFTVSLRGAVVNLTVWARVGGGFEVLVGSAGAMTLVSTDDPTGEVLEWEARIGPGGVEHSLNGSVVATTPPPSSPNATAVWANVSATAGSTDVRLDEIGVGRLMEGGAALATDGVSISRYASVPYEHAERLGLATRFGGPPDEDLITVAARCPALVVLSSGLRLRAEETDSGARVALADSVFGNGVIHVTTLGGHQRPALCALPGWNEFLLLSVKDGALWLTRGDTYEGAPRLHTATTAAVVSADVALATPAIAALADGSLLVCAQTVDADLIQLRSTDGGATWE